MTMPELTRIGQDPQVMGGKPCIRGFRVTVGTIVGFLATGHTHGAILTEYPFIKEDDIYAALACAAWRSEEVEVPLSST
jgi:uncharacterized protein (DUF433 family)